MTHFETYNVHIYKQVTRPWTEEQELASVGDFINDAELCGLLEAVTAMYLEQRGPLGCDLIVGVENPMAPELTGYVRPFMTAGLSLEILPMLRRMVGELDAMPGVGEVEPEEEEAAE